MFTIMGNPGRVLDDYSHRIGETKLLSDGDYRDYIVYAQCGPARRGGAPLKLTLPHTHPIRLNMHNLSHALIVIINTCNLKKVQIKTW